MVLRQLGLDPEVRPASLDEAGAPGEDPTTHVLRLARLKAEAVTTAGRIELVVGGDTVVVRDGVLLGKPEDQEEAVSMLLSLAGRDHRVMTGVAVAGPSGTVSGVGEASVRFRAFGASEARAYVATGEPMDKAGAYGVQGLGAALVEEIRGDYYTVVGFPVATFLELLRRSGWRYAFGRLEPLG
jgi:septum formation protein